MLSEQETNIKNFLHFNDALLIFFFKLEQL